MVKKTPKATIPQSLDNVQTKVQRLGLCIQQDYNSNQIRLYELEARIFL